MRKAWLISVTPSVPRSAVAGNRARSAPRGAGQRVASAAEAKRAEKAVVWSIIVHIPSRGSTRRAVSMTTA